MTVAAVGHPRRPLVGRYRRDVAVLASPTHDALRVVCDRLCAEWLAAHPQAIDLRDSEPVEGRQVVSMA